MTTNPETLALRTGWLALHDRAHQLAEQRRVAREEAGLRLQWHVEDGRPEWLDEARKYAEEAARLDPLSRAALAAAMATPYPEEVSR